MVDIAALSMMSSNVRVQQEASVLLMRKVMETAAQNNQGMQQIIQSVAGQSLDPNLGNSVDISV